MLLSYAGYCRYYHLCDARDTFEAFLCAASYDMRYMHDNIPGMFDQHVDYLWRCLRYCNAYRVEV